MDGFVVFIFVVVAVIWAAMISRGQDAVKKKLKDTEEGLKALQGFSATQQEIQLFSTAGLAIDEHSEQLCLIGYEASGVTFNVIPYSDVISSEIVEDGVAITKTARGSQLGGAIIGGALLGGVGIVVGGLSGKKTSSENTTQIILRITVNSVRNPIHELVFYSDPTGKDASSILKFCRDKANHWHGLLNAVVFQVDKGEVESGESKTLGEPSNFIGDELIKLGDLMSKGLLTEAEFLSQKEKLMSKS